MEKSMKIGVLGLGYVGITTTACFAKLGHEVVGIEINTDKLSLLRDGETTIVEPGISELLNNHSNRISYFSELVVDNLECLFVCVGTPTGRDGRSDLSALHRCIGDLSNSEISCPIVIRSTIPIGTCETLSSMYPSLKFIFHPEFLREGSAVKDFFQPPMIVYGTDDANSEYCLDQLYKDFDVSKFVVGYGEAESVKYTSNIFHALKIVFTNEIAKSLTQHAVNPNTVMQIFMADKQLNVSNAYLKPGFAYGGSCLEKDLQSFISQNQNLTLPLLGAISVSNETLIQDFYLKIHEKSEVFILNGLTFKEGIDDLRRSPYVTLAIKLLEEGKSVHAYDDNLNKLFGENLDILKSLLSYRNFTANSLSNFVPEATVLFCHSKRHSILPAEYKEEYKLFPNDNIIANF